MRHGHKAAVVEDTANGGGGGKPEARVPSHTDPFDGVWVKEILPLLQSEATGRLWGSGVPAGSAPPSCAPCNDDYRPFDMLRKSASPKSISRYGKPT